jgi:hypothetical protein
MQFTKLTMYANEIGSLKNFYLETFSAKLVEETASLISFKVGYTEITFVQKPGLYHYHYCFHLPCNKLNEAIDWCKDKIDLLKIEGERVVQHFESWNADSIYFLDPAGNIAEFIVRHEMNNPSHEAFSYQHILGINEVGMPTENIRKAHDLLKTIGCSMWKGDLSRFGTVGDLEGIVLLPNPALKEYWFPTEIKIQPSNLHCEAKIAGELYSIEYKEGELDVSAVH